MSTSTATFVATCDLSALVRGRSVPLVDDTSIRSSGTGWVPANSGLTCFGDLAPTRLDSTGDLRLVPVDGAYVDLPPIGRAPALRLHLGTQTELDGTPWEGDPRAFAQAAIDKLWTVHGLRLVAAFEHEFVLEGLARSSAPFGLDRYLLAEPFGSRLLEVLDATGLEPDTWLAEFGADQFEVTVAPAEGVRAADRAILLREVVRAVARENDLRASFAPMHRAGGSGSGVHVHLSLLRDDGTPVLFDGARPGGLSALGARWSAGIVRHAASIIAMTAPSPSSSLRLGRHHWSSAGAYLAERDREALLRICPTTSLSSRPQELQYNLEFRAADATANPWLVLGLLVHAGLSGLAGLAEETVLTGPPAEEDLAPACVLPATGEEALERLLTDETVVAWLPPLLLDTFVDVRRAERSVVAGLDDEALCRRIADVY